MACTRRKGQRLTTGRERIKGSLPYLAKPIDLSLRDESRTPEDSLICCGFCARLGLGGWSVETPPSSVLVGSDGKPNFHPRHGTTVRRSRKDIWPMETRL